MIALAVYLVALAVVASAALGALYAGVLLVLGAALLLGAPFAFLIAAVRDWRMIRDVKRARASAAVSARPLDQLPYTRPRGRRY